MLSFLGQRPDFSFSKGARLSVFYDGFARHVSHMEFRFSHRLRGTDVPGGRAEERHCLECGGVLGIKSSPVNGTLLRRIEHVPLFSGYFPPASPVSPTLLSPKPPMSRRIESLISVQYGSFVPRPSQTPLVRKRRRKTTITSLESLPSPRGTNSAFALFEYVNDPSLCAVSAVLHPVGCATSQLSTISSSPLVTSPTVKVARYSLKVKTRASVRSLRWRSVITYSPIGTSPGKVKRLISQPS